MRYPRWRGSHALPRGDQTVLGQEKEPREPRDDAGARGESDEARVAYESALEVWPDYLPAVQGLASLTLPSGGQDERLREWLELIAIEGVDESWRD